jgi:hypothetical protein
VTGLAELQWVLSAHVARMDAPMVTGTGWQPGLFGDHNLTRAMLDIAVPDRPCRPRLSQTMPDRGRGGSGIHSPCRRRNLFLARALIIQGQSWITFLWAM